MSLKLKFCSECGAAVSRRRVEGSLRDVCSECGTVFYRNPLPVAAAVLLNEDREVLLVKRRNDPHQGEWCLPTGFAELNESIEAAALRELREETGIEGRVLRLLAANSDESEHYGDLLFVCFEVAKVGGSEAPGDDAAALAYHALDAVPPLAFKPHETALRACQDLHRDEWAIRDSFRNLAAGGGEALISDALVALVEEHAEAISRRWLSAVRESPSTPTYRDLPAEPIRAKALAALSKFCSWLTGREPGEEVSAFYLALGRERRRQGFAQHEVLSALTLLRREIWSFARERRALADLLEVYRVMELSRRIVLFFDKALYYTALGFESEEA
jgi:ADP-ribose pyrophosphatase YjhB (NUDIX family)